MTSPGWSRPRLIDQVERHSYPTTSTPIPTNPSPTATTKKHLPSNLYIPPSPSSSTGEHLQNHPSDKDFTEVPQAPTSTRPYPATKELNNLPGTFPATPGASSTMRGGEPPADNSLGTKVIESQTFPSRSHEPEPNEAKEGAKPARKNSLIPKLFTRAKSPTKDVPPNVTEAEAPKSSLDKARTLSDNARPASIATEASQLDKLNDIDHTEAQTSREATDPLVSSECAEDNPSMTTEAPSSEASDRTLQGGLPTGQMPSNPVDSLSPRAAAVDRGNHSYSESAAGQKPPETNEIRGPEATLRAMEGHWRGHSIASSANYTDHSGIPENLSSQDLEPPTKVRLDIFLEPLNAARPPPTRDSSLDYGNVPHEASASGSKLENPSTVRFRETSREAWDDESQHSIHTLKRKRSGPSGPEPMGTIIPIKRSNSSISHLIGFWEPIKDISNKTSTANPNGGTRKPPALTSQPNAVPGGVPAAGKKTHTDGKDVETHAGLLHPIEDQPGAKSGQIPSARDDSDFPEEGPSTLPDALSGLRPVSDVTPPVLPRPTKGKVAVRKARNAAWRPFLLRIALGRQLAAQTKPGLRLLAKGETLEEDDPLISNAH
ncbi:MAG: hypothetical protein M1836_004213 [Candelina mexicana]|nr:MAG: hypothetical protein M1836_004213 [Candelina mexicana]